PSGLLSRASMSPSPLGVPSDAVDVTMPRRDLVLGLAVALATVVSRIPLRAHLLPTWDAVQFALALERYDVVAHRPHPPGYILYVAAARIVDAFVGDATASLVWLSVAASGAAVFFVYRLAWMMYGRLAAAVAAIGLATSPLFWFYGEVGLPYAVEAAVLGLGLLVPVVVWAAARAVRSGFRSREWFLLAWSLPALVVYLWLHFGQYGYLLAVLPALYILIAPVLAGALAAPRIGRRG